jgi:hypothetical protein
MDNIRVRDDSPGMYRGQMAFLGVVRYPAKWIEFEKG